MGRVFSMAKLAAGTSVIFHSGTSIVISSVT
jgi:hypothetical protein